MFPVHFRHATTEFREGGPHFARKAGTDGFLPFRVALAHARVHQEKRWLIRESRSRPEVAEIRCHDVQGLASMTGSVMKWAIAEGHRGDNPAGEAIGAALPKNGVVRQHQRALPHAEVGAALDKVRGSDAHQATVLAFEFLVLTASRSGEVRLARWDEIELEAAVWVVPAERMKECARQHRGSE